MKYKYTKNCPICSTEIRTNRKNHKYCSASCRQEGHRKRHGLSKPKFLKGVQPRKEKQGNYTSFPSTTYTFRTSNNERALLLNQLNYWQAVKEDASKGVFPIWATTGVIAGLAKSDTTGIDKLLASSLLGFFGYTIDQWRNQNKQEKRQMVQAHANQKIVSIKEQIRKLDQADKSINQLVSQKVLNKRQDKIRFKTGRQYVQNQISTMGYNEKWKYLMGDPAKNYYMLISGLPGNGKSTFAVQLAEYHAINHGRVLYIASEQGDNNLAFQQLLKRYGNSFDIDTQPEAGRMPNEVSKYSLVIIDSVNHLGIGAEQLEEVRQKNETTAFVAIMQSTKDGKYRGDQTFLHNADIHIVMEDGKARQKKSRYAPPSEIDVLI